MPHHEAQQVQNCSIVVHAAKITAAINAKIDANTSKGN
jgi:hypothetical protein